VWVLNLSIEEIDLRYVPASCTSHPVIRLKSLLRSLSERKVATIRIIFRESDIPMGIMEFLLKSHGYIVIEGSRLEDGSIQVSARRSS